MHGFVDLGGELGPPPSDVAVFAAFGAGDVLVGVGSQARLPHEGQATVTPPRCLAWRGARRRRCGPS